MKCRSLRLAMLTVLTVFSLTRGALAAPTPTVHFTVLAHTGLPLADIIWTGASFLYTQEGRRTIYAANASGHGMHLFATLPKNNGEVRCALSPGSHGFPSSTIFCHAASGQIYRLSLDGRQITLLATIPSARCSDGALTFDTGGAFGYALLAATGGSDCGSGGALFSIQPNGALHQVGTYAGPGGAENIAMAPQGFGSAAGQVLLAIDKHDHLGRLLAMDAQGKDQTIVSKLPWGLNPIAPLIQGVTGNARGLTPGLYVVDWLSHDVLFAANNQLQAYAGSIFVGTERHGFLYLVQAQPAGYRLLTLKTNLHARDYNLEGARYITG